MGQVPRNPLSLQHVPQWIGLYGQRRATNPGYTSISVLVSPGGLMQAIVKAMFVA